MPLLLVVDAGALTLCCSVPEGAMLPPEGVTPCPLTLYVYPVL